VPVGRTGAYRHKKALIPAKKIIGCRFRKVHLLNKLTLGALEKSGFSKWAAIRKSLGTIAL